MSVDQDTSIPTLPVPGSHKKDDPDDNGNPAADMIRHKLDYLYSDAPSSKKELAEAKSETKTLSKHQKYILELQKSGKTASEIQAAWHEYYLGLTNSEKFKVWEEFYAANVQSAENAHHTKPNYQPPPGLGKKIGADPEINSRQLISIEPESESEKRRSMAEVKNQLLGKVRKHKNKSWYKNLHSIMFGLTIGLVVIIVFLFGLFNNEIIAPFITPSRTASAQSLIDTGNVAISPNPLVIIPKINVELPVIYTVPTIDENLIEDNLEDGVVHFPTTAYPGQLGNGAIFGHSSNNILNPGKYKFAFVLLHDLVPGDTFTLDYNGTAYTYDVFEKMDVSPSDVSVLDNIPNHPATFSLITCDPPGTSIYRLVVVGDQISPAVSTDSAGPNQNTAPKPQILPSNAPSLWSRIVSWF